MRCVLVSCFGSTERALQVAVCVFGMFGRLTNPKRLMQLKPAVHALLSAWPDLTLDNQLTEQVDVYTRYANVISVFVATRSRKGCDVVH